MESAAIRRIHIRDPIAGDALVLVFSVAYSYLQKISDGWSLA
jgi:hypothetical protein